MRIDVWMDFNCPQSYISIVKLNELVKKFKFNDEIEIVYRSFEDDKPTNHSCEQLYDKAKALGIKLSSDIKMIDTHLAHEMMHLAKKEKCQEKVLFELFKARFEDNKDISNSDVLKEILKDDFKNELIEKTITELTFKNAIELNKENAVRRNISNLPHYRFNHTVDLEGNPTVDEFKKAIVMMYQKETNTTYCEDDNCYR